jgi:arylsulfatase A-like enzyme
MIGLAHRGFGLRDMRQHLVHTLAAAGYTTVLAGEQHVAATPDAIGYHRVIAPAVHTAAVVAPVAAAFLASAPAEPFFLDVGFNETHREFPAVDGDAGQHMTPPPPLPDTPATRRDMAGFVASARDLDAGVSVVLAALTDAGLADRTLVIYTTDHGPAFPDMKCNLTDHGIGVSLIWRGPGIPASRVCDALVSHVDIFPTLCELLEIPAPGWLQGKSLLPIIAGVRDEVNDAVFAEVTYHAAYEPQRAIRTQRYKYIRRFGNQATPVLPNVDDSRSKDVWLAYGWANRPVAAEQLYDLAFDPQERNNLIGGPDAGLIAADLRSRLDAWMRATADPLLAGTVPAPLGALVNDPAGRSPRETPRPVS